MASQAEKVAADPGPFLKAIISDSVEKDFPGTRVEVKTETKTKVYIQVTFPDGSTFNASI